MDAALPRPFEFGPTRVSTAQWKSISVILAAIGCSTLTLILWYAPLHANPSLFTFDANLEVQCRGYPVGVKLHTDQDDGEASRKFAVRAHTMTADMIDTFKE